MSGGREAREVSHWRARVLLRDGVGDGVAGAPAGRAAAGAPDVGAERDGGGGGAERACLLYTSDAADE